MVAHVFIKGHDRHRQSLYSHDPPIHKDPCAVKKTGQDQEEIVLSPFCFQQDNQWDEAENPEFCDQHLALATTSRSGPAQRQETPDVEGDAHEYDGTGPGRHPTTQAVLIKTGPLLVSRAGRAVSSWPNLATSGPSSVSGSSRAIHGRRAGLSQSLPFGAAPGILHRHTHHRGHRLAGVHARPSWQSEQGKE